MTRFLAFALAAILLAGTAHAGTPPAPHYRMDVVLGPGIDALSARVEIQLARDRAGDEYRFLLGRTFTISSATSENADVSIEETEQPMPGALQAIVVTPHPGGDDPVMIRLEYAGTLTALRQPPINSISPGLVELTVDSFWLPFPSEFNVGLTAEAVFSGLPENAVVVSTGTVRRDGEKVRVSLNRATDLALLASTSLKKRSEGVLSFYAADPEGDVAKVYRRHGRAAIELLQSLLGPLPEGVANVTLVRRESPTGYNRPGHIVVVDIESTGEKAGADLAIALFLAHELSHAWWSKADFMGADYWLVEGPAEYYAYRYADEVFGEDRMQSRYSGARGRAEKAGPVVGSGRPGDDAAYAKSMLLLKKLEDRIGRETFDAFMRGFVAAKTHTTSGFLHSLAEQTDSDTAEWFHEKLRAAEF
jgi:hypothetical protein